VELLAIAAETARNVGIELCEKRPENLEYWQKADAAGEVSKLDIWSEEQIVHRIRAQRPDDSFVGEEGTNISGSSGVTWEIDPIDGSVNFIRNIPGWTVSIAARHDGTPVVAALYDPVTGELFTAGNGEVKVNDVTARLSAKTALDHDTLVGVGYAADAEIRRLQGNALAEWFPLVRDIRRSGSSLREVAYVAAGRLDAFYGYLHAYESTAVEAFAKASGAALSIKDGRSRRHPGYSRVVMAATAELHAEFAAKVDAAEAASGLTVDGCLAV
jgi:myo-inositol-1(or 4)-monophosphatase